MNKLYFRALRSSIYGFFAMAALLFVPAGTLDYWQACLYSRLRGRVGRHYRVSRYERSQASGAADERWADGGKGTDSKDHHGCCAAGIQRALGCSGIGPSLYAVARAAVGLCVYLRSCGGFWTRKDFCTRICRDIRNIPGRCGIVWCRLSGSTKKNNSRQRSNAAGEEKRKSTDRLVTSIFSYFCLSPYVSSLLTPLCSAASSFYR